MVRKTEKGYSLTEKEGYELFILVSHARLKLSGKWKTLSEKYWKRFEGPVVGEVLKDINYPPKDNKANLEGKK